MLLDVQKDKQRSTKHTYKTKDRVTRTPLKTGGELRCFIAGSANISLPIPIVLLLIPLLVAENISAIHSLSISDSTESSQLFHFPMDIFGNNATVCVAITVYTLDHIQK